MTDGQTSDRLKVFISYARTDSSPLAEELVVGLELLGFEPYLDRHDIAGGEDWELRLGALIRQADTVLFLISPSAVKSVRCAWEVAKAAEFSKRLVPVVCIPVADEEVPAALRRLNYIYFSPGSSYSKSLGQLVDALRLDLDWIREHTRIGELASRWDSRSRADSLLLRGTELAAANAWMAACKPGAPQISEPQRRYVAASVDAETQRENVERQQVESMSRANASRSEALAKQEEAITRLKRRTLFGGLGLVGLSSASLVAAVGMLKAQDEAKKAQLATYNNIIKKEASREDIEGQIIAYASSPGQMAMAAGKSGLSPYTEALLKELSDPAVSLWAGLSRASKVVNTATHGSQRPFIASGMNGDLYFRMQPASRKRRALVITVDSYSKAYQFDEAGDARAWTRFFAECGFEVLALTNPKLQDVFDAVDRLTVSSRGPEPARMRLAGFSIQGAKPEGPPANTLAAVYFAGMGQRDGDSNYLLLPDAFGQDGVFRGFAESLKVADLESRLGKRFAAVCLILDTMFSEMSAGTRGK